MLLSNSGLTELERSVLMEKTKSYYSLKSNVKI